MKKFFRISACAMMALAMAFTITSCKKDNGGGDTPTPAPTPEVTCDYHYITSYLDHSHTIGKLSPTSADERAINAYFNEKGIKPIQSAVVFTISAATQEECDLKAKVKIKDDWDATIAKINAAELQSKLQEKTYFDYYWYRQLDDKQDTIGVWSCPVNTNFKTYGKLVFGEEEFNITRSNMSNTTDLVTNNVTISLGMSGVGNKILIAFNNVTEIPTEQVNVAYDTEVSGGIIFGDDLLHLYVIEGTLKMTKKSDYVYDIEASGKAINGDSRPINFTLNCVDVPF